MGIFTFFRKPLKLELGLALWSTKIRKLLQRGGVYNAECKVSSVNCGGFLS
jgi:hypothetical protein